MKTIISLNKKTKETLINIDTETRTSFWHKISLKILSKKKAYSIANWQRKVKIQTYHK